MMFIIRSSDAPPAMAAVTVKASRRTPARAATSALTTDWFCLGDDETIAALRAAGAEIVTLRDGWYAGDRGGGVAVWGEGRYWEIRDTPFTVREAAGPASAAAPDASGAEPVDVRGAIFGV